MHSADGNDAAQLRQVESMLTQNIDVLVIIPHNGEVAGAIVERAKRDGVPVVSYDRLIRNSEPDLYISFGNEKVGVGMRAESDVLNRMRAMSECEHLLPRQG